MKRIYSSIFFALFAALLISACSVAPRQPMPQNEIDSFINQFQIDGGYDSIIFVDRTTDLSNDYDKLIYTATRNYTNVDETYEITIYPQYNREQKLWSLSKSSVTWTFVERKWNPTSLVGNWEYSRERLYTTSRDEIFLNIESVTESSIIFGGTINGGFGQDRKNVYISFGGEYSFEDYDGSYLEIPIGNELNPHGQPLTRFYLFINGDEVRISRHVHYGGGRVDGYYYSILEKTDD